MLIKKNQFWLSVVLLTTVFFALPLKAQVTIGSIDAPNPFSLLELTTSNVKAGLRLPQLTTAERIALTDSPDFLAAMSDEAVGLVIFNTTINCVEYWNGTTWVSMCDCNAPDPFESILGSYSLCSNTNPTIADLTVKVGGSSIIRWYDNPSGGSPIAPSVALANGTYYADSYGGLPARIPVVVSLVDCSVAPSIGRTSTFVNVMYDFQYQTLGTYVASGGGAVEWQWEVSADNSTWNPISGAVSATYTIPINFIHKPEYAGIDSVFFRCVLTNPTGSIASDALDIYFIRTTDGQGSFRPGYGVEEGVRYLTLQRGAKGVHVRGDEIKMALLNLGASGTGAYRVGVGPINDDGAFNDAGDLGDFYQWGRVADGHEHVIWSKNPNTPNMNVLSGTVAFGGSTTYDAATGQVTGGDGVGKFITHNVDGEDWSNEVMRERWGGYTGSFIPYLSSNPPRTYADITLSGWFHPENNPCPGGWATPSRWQWWDLFRPTSTPGGGEWNIEGYSTGLEADAIYNIWHWRSNNGPDTGSGAVVLGGMIIENKTTGSKVFLPAVGRRTITGAYSTTPSDVNGNYWSTRNYDTGAVDPDKGIYAGQIHVNNSSGGSHFNLNGPKANGVCVRCMKE
jgi:hypothetical protein